ncbi:hypothetical protein BH24DEI2_BH24DEI2_00560 [soil metagenome]
MAGEMASDKSDQERIQALVTRGKITQAEADRLVAALQDSDSSNTDSGTVEPAEASRGEVERGTNSAADLIQNTLQHETVIEESNTARTAAAQIPEENLPEELRWVRVSMFTGDLDVCVDPGLSEPAVDGEPTHFEVRKTGEDYVVGPVRREQDRAPRREGIDGFIDGITEFVGDLVGHIGGDLNVRIPVGFGIILDSKAGDVDVRDVPFVKASLVAGDLDLRNVGGIDLSMSAGDVDASLRLTSGTHRIKVSAGDVDVTLLNGSSVSVVGAVSMGDVDADAPLSTKRTGMGGSLSGQVGDGRAKLELSVSAGDLDVRGG